MVRLAAHHSVIVYTECSAHAIYLVGATAMVSLYLYNYNWLFTHKLSVRAQ